MDKRDKEDSHYDRQEELAEFWDWSWGNARATAEQDKAEYETWQSTEEHVRRRISQFSPGWVRELHSRVRRYRKYLKRPPRFGRISGWIDNVYYRQGFDRGVVSIVRSPCTSCGKPFYAQRRSAKYCSWECRRTTRSDQARQRGDPRVLRDGEVWSIECDGCGKQFEARRRDAKTCSDRCRKRVQRAMAARSR